MKNKVIKLLTLSILSIVLASNRSLAQPVTLSGTNYSYNFDNIGAGLPGEWLVYTNAKSSQLGTLVSFLTSVTNTWSGTSFAFKNYASVTNTVGGTNFVGTEPISSQSNTLNRALGVRGVGAADPGCAFVLKIANTTGFGKFKMDVDMLLLNAQGRSNNWTVDFGISPDGSSPATSFTVVSNNFFGTYTNASAFGTYHRTVDFGALLDDQPGPIWIRIVNLTGSIGSGSRPTVGIDNFNLGFTNIAIVVTPPVIVSAPANVSAYVGDTATFTVANSGTAPFNYQWYTPDLNSPISGANSATYQIVGVTTNAAGNYYVIVANSIGSATNSSPAVLTVGVRTPIPTTIYNIRTNQDSVNWSPIDTTNFYTVTGVVISRTNMSTSGNASFFIEDTNSLCGIDVFIAGDTVTRPAYGDIMQITGPISQFNGVLECNLNSANPTHVAANLGPSGYTIPAKTFSFAFSNNVALMETNYEGSLVVVPNVFIQNGGSGSNFVSGASLQMTNGSGQTFTLFIDSRLGDIIGQPIPAGATTVTGYMAQFKTAIPFNSGYQLVPTYAGAITTTINPIPLSIQASGANVVLSWNDASFNLQSATNVGGPYGNIGGAVSPFTTNAVEAQLFFRLLHP